MLAAVTMMRQSLHDILLEWQSHRLDAFHPSPLTSETKTVEMPIASGME